jgi:hypothetical protein
VVFIESMDKVTKKEKTERKNARKKVRDINKSESE